MGDGQGYSTTFTVTALPVGFQYETDSNDSLDTATLLMPETVGSRSVSLLVDTMSETDVVRVSASDQDDLGRTGTGVARTSLFMLSEASLQHVGSDVGSIIEESVTREGESTYFAVASDYAGNRTAVDLRENPVDSIRIDSSLTDDPWVSLPAQILLASSTKVVFSGTWYVLPSIIKNGRAVQRVSSGGQTIEFENPLEDQTPVLRQDVDHSGSVSAMDALLLINYLNRKDRGDVPLRSSVEGFFFDVSGDHQITSLDALEIISWLHASDIASIPEAEPIDVLQIANVTTTIESSAGAQYVLESKHLTSVERISAWAKSLLNTRMDANSLTSPTASGEQTSRDDSSEARDSNGKNAGLQSNRITQIFDDLQSPRSAPKTAK